MFLNLFFNAIKFTKEGGSIEVSAVREKDFVIIEVKDSGIGISEDKISAVFDRFWQDDEASARVRQGTGIGLALVKGTCRTPSWYGDGIE